MKNAVIIVTGLLLVLGLQAQATTGISGRVVNAQSGLPISQAAVCTGHGGAYTDSTGHYLIQIQPGTYQLHASATGFQTVVRPDSVAVVEGRVTDGINFALEPIGGQTGGISGRVTDARTQLPISGALIVASGPHGVGDARSYACGGYQIVDLAPGTYQVCASADGYESAVYPESVTVVAGQVTPSINFALVPSGGQPGGISGEVIDARTREPIAGVQVCTGHGGAYTDSTGFYLIEPLDPGKYRVSATATGYEPAVYPESVVVVAGQVTERVNFELVPVVGDTGGISGRVVNARTQEPINDALVAARGPNGEGHAYSRACGGYEITGLPPGKYQVQAEAVGFEPATYPESVTVVAGQVTVEICFALEPVAGHTGGIAGFVTNAQTHEPIPGALVTAIGPNGRGEAHTCQQGGYQIANLPAGRYRVCARAQGFESEVYPESVLVVAGQITERIDFALEPVGGPTGGISGQVTSTRNGEPIFGALVRVEGPGRGQANTCVRGYYYIGELPPGLYVAMATARGFQPSPLETVEVHAGQVTQEVDFALEPEPGQAGGISGAVIDSATRQPLVGANVFAWGRAGQGNAISDSTGRYVIEGLGAGEYEVRAHARGYHPKAYPEVVRVEPGQITPEICFALVPSQGAGVAGFVYDGTTQTEVSGALVVATSPSGSGQAYTDSHGDYLIEGLLPDEYDVTVTAQGYNQGSYVEPVLVETGVIAAFISPPVYPLTGVQSPAEPVNADRLSVEPSLFSERTTIRWQMTSPGHVVLRVLDNAGRVVRTLGDLHLEPGSYSVAWNGKDAAGRRLGRGTYFCELRTASRRLVARTVLIE